MMKTFTAQMDACKLKLARFAENAPADAPTFACERCQDQGFIEEAGVGRRCPCTIRTASGVPVLFAGVTLEQVKPLTGNKAALERAYTFAKGARDLFLSGPVGTGKTMLACALANEYVRVVRKSALFVRWPMALHKMQPGNMAEDERRALERRLFTSSLLVMDDLGAERDEASDFTRRMSYLTYEVRGDAGLRTIITSNLSLAEVARNQGDDRLASRIAGRSEFVRTGGPDQRLAARLGPQESRNWTPSSADRQSPQEAELTAGGSKR